MEDSRIENTKESYVYKNDFGFKTFFDILIDSDYSNDIRFFAAMYLLGEEYMSKEAIFEIAYFSGLVNLSLVELDWEVTNIFNKITTENRQT